MGFHKMMSLTKLIWVGIIVDLIPVCHAKPARVNVDLDVNIKSPEANQGPLDGSSDRATPLEGPQMHSRHSDTLQKTDTPEQKERLNEAQCKYMCETPLEIACPEDCM